MTTAKFEQLPTHNAAEPRTYTCTAAPLGDASAARECALMAVPVRTRITGIRIVPTTALAAQAANYWTLTVQAGATVVASVTSVAAVAVTGRDMVLSATDANRLLAAGTALKLVATPATGDAVDLAGNAIAVTIIGQPY